MSTNAQKSIALELNPQAVHEISSLFDAASRILGLRAVASVSKFSARIQEEVAKATAAEAGEVVKPEAAAPIIFRVTEPECNELAGLFDNAIKHSGIGAVHLVHKYMTEITKLLETAIVSAPANVIPLSRK